jgi:hypothetical protein
MASSQTERPKFYEEQYLGAEDLTAAVDYARVQQARHALGAHTWGIAIGLQLKETPQPGGEVSVHVLPGYAWDGYGRPIVVLSPYRIPEERFSASTFDPANVDPKGKLIPIWISYDESATPSGGFDVCDRSSQISRVQETFRLEIGEMTTTDRSSGTNVAGRSLSDPKTALKEFDPTTTLVYDESVPHQDLASLQRRARWLIPLGFVRWLPVQNQPGHFVVRDDSGPDKDSDKIRRVRRYVGVVAEEIAAADGAIRLRNRGSDPASSSFEPPKIGQTDSDLVWVEGNLRVEGDIRASGGGVDFRDSTGKDLGVPLWIRRSDAAPGSRALQIAIGPKAQTTNRFAVVTLDGATLEEKFVVTSGGNVGIGTSSPVDKLQVMGDFRLSGAARKLGGGAWTDSSDARLKKEIAPLTDALGRLLKLRGVRFEWREPDKMGNLSGPQIGLVAQEVERVFPEWVSDDPEGYRELTVRGFEALVIEALRELKAEVDDVKARLDESETPPRSPRKKQAAKK